ncbi:MAG: hypothetical protein ACOC8Q_00595 [Desulfosalsimonas sp.]
MFGRESPQELLHWNSGKKGGDYQIRASARTNRFVDIFYRLRYNAKALVAADTLRPLNSVYKRKDKRSQNTLFPGPDESTY